MPSWTLICNLCISHQRCAYASTFPATYFSYFVARFAQTPSIFLWISWKKKPSKGKNVRLRESISMFTSIYRLIIRNNCLKSLKNPNVGGGGGEMVIEKWRLSFEEKKKEEDWQSWIERLNSFAEVAIKGGGRLLPHGKMLLIPIKLFLFAG